MKLGVLGGTFDPVHNGHLYIAEEVRQAVGLEKILFIPSAYPPHKTVAMTTPSRHRLEMVRLAVSGNPFFEVSSVEVDLGGMSYSVRTIEHLLEHYGSDTEMHFIIGADAFTEIMTWYEVERLLSLCHFVVTSRPHSPFARLADIPFVGRDSAHLLTKMDEGRQKAAITLASGRTMTLLRTLLLEISATDIRDRIRNNRSVRYLLPEEVQTYIMTHSLYLTRTAALAHE